MRNQIPCAAPTLSQLQPDLIQSVAPRSAFTIGHQYFSQRRVRIIQADDGKISSEVGGANGLYQQTIKLADGNLVTKCSCPSIERPLCRHCVAALLEYSRQVSDRGTDASHEKHAHERNVEDAMIVDVTPHEAPAGKPATDASPLGAGLREITLFIEWLQAAVPAIKAGQPLPTAPRLGPGDAWEWVATIQELEEESRQRKDYSAELETRLNASEDQASALGQELEAFKKKLSEVQAAFDRTKLELDAGKARLAKLLELDQERHRLGEQLKGQTSDLMKTAEKVDRLVAELNQKRAG